MLKKIYSIAILTLATVAFTSCESLILIKESDFIAGETALRTVKNNESLLMSAYGTLGTEMNIQMNGVFSDELKPGDFYARQSTHEWQYNYDDVSIRDDYTAITPNYQIIDRVNRVLEALPNAVEEEPSDAQLMNKIKGEALFLRAYAHFELFRYYSDNYSDNGLAMPYMEEPSLETHERIGMKEYFTLLLRDLNESKSLLPNDLNDPNRANRLGAVGLHARVALYMNNWADAVQYSTEYINAIPLATGDEFLAMWKDENVAEQAFRLPRTTSSRVGSRFRGLFTRNAEGELVLPSSTSWIPSQKLVKSYSENDLRLDAYITDEPLYTEAGRPFSHIVNKYSGTGYATGNENVANLKVFRTGEMYLIRAEAHAESNDLASATKDLNALRAARITNYEDETFGSTSEIVKAIIDERFKELAFEGHRFWDLKRKGMSIDRWEEDAPSQDGAHLSAGNFRFVFPIPRPEMLANTKMVQNPGYGS